MQAMISALMVLVACGLDGQARPPTYGQVIEAMAEAAPGFGDSRLTALVSDLSLQCLERGQWAESDGRDTLRVLGGRLRNRGRASARTRHAETARKRAQRQRQKAQAGIRETDRRPPVAREVLDAEPDATCERSLRRLEARDRLRALGFENLAPRAQACLLATDVMALRYRAAAEILGLESEEQVRKIRSRALASLRPAPGTSP